jgi:predicted metal-dependent hydrolase
MTTDATSLSVSGMHVSVVRKPIKNLHLGVYPPDGRVRVAAPMAISDAAVRVAVIGKLRWIKQKQASASRAAARVAAEMTSGESHYYRGRRYRLQVVATDGPPRVEVRGHQALVLHVRPGSTAEDREGCSSAGTATACARSPRLLARWQAKLGVEVAAWGIKRMKTKWGSCNPRPAASGSTSS